jgi:preprotein translocase subunit SecY
MAESRSPTERSTGESQSAVDAMISGSISRLLSLFKSPDTLKRLLITLGAIAIYRIGLQIPIPGINIDLIALPERFHGTFTLFSLGIGSYLNGSVVVLLLSAVISPLRRLRDGSPKDNRRFDLFIYLAAVLLSIQQARGLAILLESTSRDVQPLASTPLGLELSCVLFFTAGTMLLVWMANVVTEKGILNGVALFVVVGILSKVEPFAKSLQAVSVTRKITPGEISIISLIPILLLAISTMFILARRTIRLDRPGTQGGASSLSPEFPELPIRVMAAGVIPVSVAQSVMFIPTTILTFFPESESLQKIAQLLYYTSPTYALVNAVLIVLFTFLFAAVVYDPKDVVLRLKRYGYAIAGMKSDQDAADYVDTIILRTVWFAAAYLVILKLLSKLIFSLYEIPEYTFFSDDVLIVTAVTISGVQSLIAETGGRQWLTVFSGETVIDAELVKAILREANIPARVVSNRVTTVTGSLGVWEVCRPRIPSLVIHRRLGQGTVEVRVPGDRFEQARGELALRQIE